MPKIIREAYLLIRQHADGTVTVRQVHVDDAGNYAFGDADVVLRANQRAAARNLIRSLKTEIEAREPRRAK
ncbi:MAG: hypothetical protein D6706_22245 [Chloroflexi bacterium]|nr:MAG: hypothetical protein D6706_22245 [Chloroflexota bacterium]